jgi:hypothetical protein
MWNISYILGCVITNDARGTREIKCSIAMVNAAFNKKKVLPTRKLDYYFKEENSRVLHLNHSFYGVKLGHCGK